MASLKNLLPESVTADVDLLLGGPTLRMTYHPRKLSPNSNVQIDGQDPEGRHYVMAVCRAICNVVSAWELTGPVPVEDMPDGTKEGSVIAEGEPVPLDPLTMSFLPLPVLEGIMAGVGAAARPNPVKTANGSRGAG